MFHGQATVERAFYVKKQATVENLTERSAIAQRSIHDHIKSVGGLTNVKTSKQLLASSARHFCLSRRVEENYSPQGENLKEKGNNRGV